MTIPTANLGFSTASSAKKLIPGDCDNDRQLEMAVRTFCSPILQFLIVDRCRNQLANLLTSSTSSKIPNLALECRRYLSEFQRCIYFHFGVMSIFPVVGRCCTYTSLANTIFHIYMVLYEICRWNLNCPFFHSFRDISIPGFGRHFQLSVIIVIA